VSEEFGDDDEVGPAAHEARGERVTQDVGGGVVVSAAVWAIVMMIS